MCHDPCGNGLLITRQRNMLRRLIGACLHPNVAIMVRLQNGAIVNSPGREDVDNGLRNGLELVCRFLLAGGYTHQIVEHVRLSFSTCSPASPLAQCRSQMRCQNSSDKKDKQGNPLFYSEDDKGI